MKTAKTAMETARTNKEIAKALYEAFKWSNRYNEKLLRVEEIKSGTCRTFHYSLKEEMSELRGLMKKASKKILYLNYLMDGKVLERQYDTGNVSEVMEMIFDFTEMVNQEIAISSLAL